MKEMIAYCGIDCHQCGAYIATQNDDNAKRVEVAEFWSKQFKSDIKPEDINCDGCPTEDGNIVSYCTVCGIRKCGKRKGVTNCAYCDEYPCDGLESFWKMLPHAQKTLERIRASL